MSDVAQRKQRLMSKTELDPQWEMVYQLALETENKEPRRKPSKRWIARMLRAEHSPIRYFRVTHRWIGIPSWVSVHLVRHWLGIVHWVGTQRVDRTNVDRDSKPQNAPVNHRFVANAQSVINISRRRLCKMASTETQNAWKEALQNMDPILVEACVPECVYRGWCYEPRGCGYDQTQAYRDRLVEYRKCTVKKKKE